MGSGASQRAVRPYMAVPPQEAGHADFGLPAIAVGVQEHLLVLDCAPHTFRKDIVVATLSA